MMNEIASSVAFAVLFASISYISGQGVDVFECFVVALVAFIAFK